MRDQVEAILDKLRPMLMMDGGNIELVDVKDGEVFVHPFQRSCKAATSPPSSAADKAGRKASRSRTGGVIR